MFSSISTVNASNNRLKTKPIIPFYDSSSSFNFGVLSNTGQHTAYITIISSASGQLFYSNNYGASYTGYFFDNSKFTSSGTGQFILILNKFIAGNGSYVCFESTNCIGVFDVSKKRLDHHQRSFNMTWADEENQPLEEQKPD